ncbi:hypothetical protein [Pseudomonas urethralis]|uniref:hypothetical protein n=1 Tax=Pseudomonas urethralis TaxID=2740517 RepID=UPI001596BFC4|nr:hypothetical protein [Pseudomonas urethralis]
MNQEYEARQQWLASLQPGEQVAIYDGTTAGRSRYLLAQVVRLTGTQIIVSHYGQRYRKSGGVMVGKSYTPKIEPVTDLIKERIRTSENRDRFKSLTYRTDRLTDAQITAMLAGYDSVSTDQERTA